RGSSCGASDVKFHSKRHRAKNLQWAPVRMTREALSYILRETVINTLTGGRGHRGLELPVSGGISPFILKKAVGLTPKRLKPNNQADFSPSPVVAEPFPMGGSNARKNLNRNKDLRFFSFPTAHEHATHA
ncbi:MAG: hypothetical protein Q8K34_04070, partial [Hydrogenophaga sp.]|nr:hypothetical protein [Hydrogenophaga sp.]